MSTPTRSGAPSRRTPSLTHLTQDMAHLAPRQLSDEIALAKLELQGTAKHFAISGVAGVIALAFLGLLTIALVVAAIMGLATIMAPWLAALIVAAAFLLIIGIVALIAYLNVKKALPVPPIEAIRGIKYDLGVIRAGSNFDPATLDEKKNDGDTSEDSDGTEGAEKEGDEEPQEPAPTREELESRLSERRAHMVQVRDGLGRKLDVKAQAEDLAQEAKDRADHLKTQVVSFFDSGSSAQSRSDAQEFLTERWKPLTILGLSVIAIVVWTAKLFKSK